MWSEPVMRYQNRGVYRTAETACISKIPKNIATVLFGAVLCSIVANLCLFFIFLIFETARLLYIHPDDWSFGWLVGR